VHSTTCSLSRSSTASSFPSSILAATLPLSTRFHPLHVFSSPSPGAPAASLAGNTCGTGQHLLRKWLNHHLRTLWPSSVRPADHLIQWRSPLPL
jgi:hypothetical protein